ncbi:YciI family protein [Actinotalea sp. K2]|uniref:YciI family protein n=1 Tax=Actinotalea sp. K2 TaxID=2939438 RepID=UPI0020177EBE|nr:YciI family protein [Actinotalea sp. K2]MCL3862013.1 YciI family protein [Actinotalea sp. K2]
MTIYAVQYTYDSRDALRDEVRPEHRDYFRSLADAGSLLGSGPYSEGAPGALLILRAPDDAALDALLAADPFHREGLISQSVVRPWNLVIGPWASTAD